MVPRIHHAAAWVADIEGVCSFYQCYFAAEVGPLYENIRKGFSSRFLVLGDGARLELMSSTALHLEARLPGGQHLGFAHLAISLGCEAAVDAMAERMQRDGVPIVDGPRRTGDGYYECVVLDPEGNRIELTA